MSATVSIHPCGKTGPGFEPETVEVTLSSGIGHVDDLENWRADLGNLLPELDKSVILEDAECLSCKWLAICGGRTFCKDKGLDGTLNTCDFWDYDLDEFLRIFGRESRFHPEIFVEAPRG